MRISDWSSDVCSSDLAGTVAVALTGLVLQVAIFRFMPNQELQQALVTIAISIILADLMIWIWGSDIYQLDPPDWLYGVATLPIIGKFPMYKDRKSARLNSSH